MDGTQLQWLRRPDDMDPVAQFDDYLSRLKVTLSPWEQNAGKFPWSVASGHHSSLYRHDFYISVLDAKHVNNCARSAFIEANHHIKAF